MLKQILNGASGWLTAAVVVRLAVALGAAWFVIWAFAEITEEVLEGESRAFDRAVLLWIGANVPGWLDNPMRAVTALGYYYVVLPLMALAALLFYLKGWRLSAVMLCVSTAGGIFLTTVLKNVFRRDRPEVVETGYAADSFSFPSGHATVAVGFYGALALILAYHLRGRARTAALAAGTALVSLIGFSRLYLGVHYPTDVAAGFLAAPLWLVGVGSAYALWLSARRLKAAENRRKEAR